MNMCDSNRSEAVREELNRLILENRPSVAYTTEEWVNMAQKVAPQFDYSKVIYKDKNTNVTIICKEHGEFTVNPKYFLWTSAECPKCKELRRKEKQRERFIEKARKIHGDKYDYSNVEYKTSFDKVCIICPKHGEFLQSMGNHLSGSICPKCANEENGNKRKKTTEEFLTEVKKINGDKFDYSKTTYIKTDKPAEFICHKKDENGEEHGAFYINPHSLVAKKYILECPKCRFEMEDFGRRLTLAEFVKRSNVIHFNKYDYSKFIYKNGKTKSIIICPEHGEFLQNGESHLAGQGCPICGLSHLERKLMSFFTIHGIKFIPQKRFNWLGLQSIDVFVPEKKIAIECQGKQHYKEVYYRSKKWTKEKAQENFKVIKERDSRKRQLCKENGIELIYFLEPKFEKYETSGNKYFTDISKLIEYINSR